MDITYSRTNVAIAIAYQWLRSADQCTTPSAEKYGAAAIYNGVATVLIATRSSMVDCTTPQSTVVAQLHAAAVSAGSPPVS